MKLIHQWFIIIAICLILWLVYIQAGGVLTKLACFKDPSSSATITQHIIVQPRQSSLDLEVPAGLPKPETEKIEENTVPQVPPTPPQKTATQKRRARRKTAKLKIITDYAQKTAEVIEAAQAERSPRSEWDWCDKDFSDPKMIE